MLIQSCTAVRPCRPAASGALRRTTCNPVRVISFNPRQQQDKHQCRSLGSDATDGWLDLAKLVSGGGQTKTPYDELASAIGRDIYADIAGWHLYMRDMGTGVPGGVKMSQALAMQLGPQVSKGLREADVEAVLKKIPIKLGGGRTKVSLFEVMPSICVGDLVKVCEGFARKR